MWTWTIDEQWMLNQIKKCYEACAQTAERVSPLAAALIRKTAGQLEIKDHRVDVLAATKEEALELATAFRKEAAE